MELDVVESRPVLTCRLIRFPNDETLKGTYSQFLLGPSLLVTPVLIPNVNSVNGVFPGIGEGTRWYEW